MPEEINVEYLKRNYPAVVKWLSAARIFLSIDTREKTKQKRVMIVIATTEDFTKE